VCNGKKSYNAQNYRCKDCKCQFIANCDRKYKGTIAWFVGAIVRALVRGCGIRDIAAILEVSIGKVLKTLLETSYDT
jgi:transposase-like protein